ncbi:hypothetical protein [Aquisphaera insulae]|uniref:hypothetical protein n=1 Tax=Aquisphaera insulae TaxID=2712864 RepID=UPI0013ED5232|nr:hypothetical protein [Aquisphaera insulae]
MLSSLSLWMLAAALGQAPAPAEAPAPPAWLKAIPADVDAAVRIRGVDAAHADVSAMLKAFSPALAERAEPALSQGLGSLRHQFGDGAVTTPWVGLLRLEGAEAASWSLAILVLEGEQANVLASINGGKAPELKEEGGGVSSFEHTGTGKLYSAKGPGCVAFGTDKSLIAAIAKPAEKALDSVLTPAQAAQLLKGDVGLYVNANALVKRYWERIDGVRQGLMAALDQAGQQAGNAGSMEAAKDIYNALFDALKDADALVLNVDAAAEGLTLGGVITAKPDSKSAEGFAKLSAGPADGLAKLPADAAYFLYMNIDSSTLDRLMNSNLRMMNSGEKPTPEQAEALAKLATFGRVEALGSVKMAGGMGVLNVTRVGDPAGYIEASKAVQRSFKAGGAKGLIKDITSEPVAEPFRGIPLTHVVTKLDIDRFVEQAASNRPAAEMLRSMFPGGETNSWIGTDGTLVFQATAATWDEARALIGSYLDGKLGIGESASFKQVRAGLPEKANIAFLMSAQGFTSLIANSLAAALSRPELKPGELPSEPAVFGFATTPAAPHGVEFRAVVPAAVGPVFEKGLVPLFGAMRPPANN